MGIISAAEAAQRLGVSSRRVRERIADGSLPAQRIGSQWAVDEASLPLAAESKIPGRPLSERSAWALLALSQADYHLLDALAPAERSRARDRLRRLLAQPLLEGSLPEVRSRAAASQLRSWLRNRAGRRLYRAAPPDLPDLRGDGRVVLSGLSHPDSGIASADLVEGYVAAADVDAVIHDYLLSVAADKDANVVLHVASGAVREHSKGIAPLLLAADLAEHRRPREEARAAELLRGLAEDNPTLITEDKPSRRDRSKASP